jgi:tRNA threonylcarbamoyladenosine modification (KEOPS) complex  Pcc1 subunit
MGYNVTSKPSAKALIKINLKSETQAKLAFESLKPETLIYLSSRSRTKLSSKGKMLVLAIYAKDVTALRAAINSYCRFLAGIIKVLKLLSEHLPTCNY